MRDGEEKRSILEAVHEGSLVELPDFAKTFGVPGRLFVTPFMMKKLGEDGAYELEGRIGLVINGRLNWTGYQKYGAEDCGDSFAVFEPHERFGHVFVVAEKGKLEELNVDVPVVSPMRPAA
ncbi:hypothetical protein [Paludisphaera rhizosphaerae]|uniref:hypothetical protein n=1 Tax=Paludisphaera rhizosphaerae TaxID=2711216 RepID=UPI0013EAFC8E|nr:hypothetical protein [Paludisphaera rhizosphaerae]